MIRIVSSKRPGRGASSLHMPETVGEARIRFVCISPRLVARPGKYSRRGCRADAKQIGRNAFGEADADREILREANPIKLSLYDRQTTVGKLGQFRNARATLSTSPVKVRSGAVMIRTSARSPT